MITSALGWIHTVFAFLGIATGAWVLLLPKGTRWHRTLGHVYVTAMLGLAMTALFIYDLFGSFGPFHFAALVTVVTVGMGMWTVLVRGSREWLEQHAAWMAWSYVGLMAAFVAESATRFIMPLLAPRVSESFHWGAFWALVGLGSFAAAGLGAWLIRTRLPRSIERTPQAIRRERQTLRERERDAAPTAGAD